MSVKNLMCWSVATALLFASVATWTWAQTGKQKFSHREHAMNMAGAMKCGANHMAMMKKPSFKISMENYDIPDVTLQDKTGKSVPLQSMFDGNHAVAVNFIFTTCTTICPIMSATFAQMRKALGKDADRIQLVSITIDPEHDTPAVLSSYAKRFHATAGWRFLTGKPKDIEQVLRTFDVWTGTKTNHQPITLMRGKGDSQWTRVDGLASGTALANQARTVFN